MARVTITDFSGGINTKVPAWKLAANQFQACENAVIKDGQATPLKGLGSSVTTIGAGTLAWFGKLGSTWLGSTTARYAVDWQGTHYAYITVGSAPPQWTNGTTTEDLGGVAPSAGLITAATGAAGVVNGSVTYVVTNVTAMGQESGPNLPSTSVTASLDQVDLSAIPTGPAGTTSRKIYRSVDGIYRLVTTIADNVTTTYTDNVSDLDLGDPLLTEGSDVAPNLEGFAIDAHLGRLWGWADNVLYWSNSGAPGSWSVARSLRFNENIVAACKTSRGLLVLTVSSSYFVIQAQLPSNIESLVISSDDDTAFRPESTNNTFGCAAPFSLVQTDRGPVWWDDQGLVLFEGNTFRLLTADVFTDAQIAAFSTTNMRAAYSKGFYYLFHSTGTLICDLRQAVPVFTTSTLTNSDVDAVYVHTDGTFYCADGNAVKEWNAGSNLTMRLKTPEYIGGDVNQPFWATYADVFTSGSVTAQWYQDGSALGTSESVSSSNGYARCWSEIGNQTRCALEVSSTSAITQMEVA